MSVSKKKRKQNYVNNKDLYEHMKVYHAQYQEAMRKGEPKPELSRYIAQCILLIAEKQSTRFNFAKYSYRDEMVLIAIENCVRYIHNFNPEKSKNPFAYITMMVKRSFFRTIEVEHDEQYRVLSNSQRFLIMDQLNPNQVMGESVELYDNLLDFMKEYEEKKIKKMNKKKEKRKAKIVDEETTPNIEEIWNQ